MTISKKAARSSDPVTHYAQSVVAGRAIACKLVVKACQRHLDDIDHAAERGLVWRPDIARHKLRFFPDYLRHSKGELAGKPLTLEPWEEFCIGSLFGWFRVGGLRRFKTGYLEIAKKNGKSTIGAGIGLIGLVADFEPGAEVYATATKRDQARIVFSEAQRMVKASPALSKSVSNRTLNLAVEETGSKFEPLSSDEKTADGLNPSMVIVDELHRHKSRALRNLMESGQVSRRQPMMVIITTAGDENPTSAYAVEHDYAIKILDRVFPRDDYFTFITTIDDRDKWDDPKELAKANPNLGVSVKLSALMELVAKAQKSPADKADFLRYHCNVRQSDATKYIDMDLWRANGGPPFDPAGLAGRVCYAGLDLSSRIDLSSLVLLFPPIAGEILWRVLPYFWMPADTIPRREKKIACRSRAGSRCTGSRRHPATSSTTRKSKTPCSRRARSMTCARLPMIRGTRPSSRPICKMPACRCSNSCRACAPTPRRPRNSKSCCCRRSSITAATRCSAGTPPTSPFNATRTRTACRTRRTRPAASMA